MKTIKLYAKIGFGIFLLFLTACGENHALKKETIYIDEANKAWLGEDTINQPFLMSDTNDIKQSFIFKYKDDYFNKSWGGFLGINTKMTFTEYHYKSYENNTGLSFTISLTAGYSPFGDELYISLDQTEFAYDLKYKTLTRIYTPQGYLSKIAFDTGYEIDEPIFSKAIILDSLTTNYSTYKDVLYFELNDFLNSMDDLSIVKIYVAKNIGLVKFQYKNGLYYERKE